MKKTNNILTKYKNFICYIIFGVLTTVINVIAYYVCYNTAGLTNVLSTVVAWGCAVTFAFFTNKTIVFESKSWEASFVLLEAVKFYGCRLGTGSIEIGIMFALVDMMHLNGIWMKVLTNVVAIIINYICSKLIIFKIK